MNSKEKNKQAMKGRPPLIPPKGGDQEEIYLKRFSFYQIRKEKKLILCGSSCQVLFLQKGSGTIQLLSGPSFYLSEGECLMVRSPETSFDALEESLLTLWSPEAGLHPSDHSFLRSLHPEVIRCSYQKRPLPILPAVTDFLNLLYAYEQDGRMETELLYELKQRELFLLFQHYYPREELVQLFYPLVYRMDVFREKILDALKKVQSSAELMKVVGMKRTSFERKFRRNFGISAHQWILRQKAVEVRKSLEDLTLSLEEVRKQHRFNSATHFVRFCKTQLGATPTELRKENSPLNPLKGTFGNSW